MTATFVNCGLQTPLALSDGVRVTFVGAWYLLDSEFALKFESVYDSLGSTGARPLSGLNASADLALTTVDLLVHDAQTVAQLLDKLNALNFYISVSRFEKLSAQERQQASQPAGATARDTVDQQEKEKQDTSGLSGWLKQLAAQFGTTLHVLLWIIAGVLVAVLLVYAGKLSKTLKA